LKLAVFNSSAVFVLLSVAALHAQTASDGARIFESRCAVCHGGDGKGGEFGPDMMLRAATRSDRDLASLIHAGIPNRGMPAFDFSEREMAALVAHLRKLAPPLTGTLPNGITVMTESGPVQGVVKGQGARDLQLQTADGRVMLLRRTAGDRFRQVTSQTGWPSYDGADSGNRYSSLKQIDRTNVKSLRAEWIFAMDDTTPLETTPLVVQGIMYVTTANQCFALDAGSGREIWHFQRPKTKGLVGNAVNGINRGVAVAGDRVFLATDNAHLMAFNRFNGAVLWEIEMADWHKNYSNTSAPLAIGDMVVSGIAGGDAGVRGFVAAFDQASGKERWRFWTAPRAGEPGAETWKGKTLEHPGAATWFTGTYDAELGLTYWAAGNPGEDHNGDGRAGDNLYSDSVVALDAKTGKLRWHYQFTPHDVWDWDAQEPLTLVDADWQGRPRKLLMQANRNGFFYVLDRATGELLLGKPFVDKLTWAREIGHDGRPVLNPDQLPTDAGVRVCPSLLGAANWWSSAFHPGTGLYYVQSLEACSIYTKRDSEWEAGQTYMGGSTRDAPTDPPHKFLRAIDYRTGARAWELPETGPGTVRGGVLATAGGLVFFCEDNGAFSAVDAASGKPLWSFQANHFWRASPMTYEFDGRQYVAVASGPNILAFALPE
jgi:alcohol dehydrogenase (cytochrome c)